MPCADRLLRPVYSSFRWPTSNSMTFFGKSPLAKEGRHCLGGYTSPISWSSPIQAVVMAAHNHPASCLTVTQLQYKLCSSISLLIPGHQTKSRLYVSPHNFLDLLLVYLASFTPHFPERTSSMVTNAPKPLPLPLHLRNSEMLATSCWWFARMSMLEET